MLKFACVARFARTHAKMRHFLLIFKHFTFQLWQKLILYRENEKVEMKICSCKFPMNDEELKKKTCIYRFPESLLQLLLVVVRVSVR